MRTAYPVYALAFLLISSPSRASVDGQDPQPPPDTQDAPVRVIKPAPRPVSLARDGTMSISATRLTLKAVLDDISVQAKFPIVVAESLERERLSLQLGGVSLEEGLKRLLAAYDAFYLYSPSDGEKPGGLGERPEPAPIEKPCLAGIGV